MVWGAGDHPGCPPAFGKLLPGEHGLWILGAMPSGTHRCGSGLECLGSSRLRPNACLWWIAHWLACVYLATVFCVFGRRDLSKCPLSHRVSFPYLFTQLIWELFEAKVGAQSPGCKHAVGGEGPARRPLSVSSSGSSAGPFCLLLFVPHQPGAGLGRRLLLV